VSDPTCDVVVIGAGAAGMMCAIEAGRRGRSVVLLEKASAPGRKIRISGGGRCNFTNLSAPVERFVSTNPRFPTSALARYRPEDFIAWVEAEGIAYHEKKLGQLFCDGSAAQIVNLLTSACEAAGAAIRTDINVNDVKFEESGFWVHTEGGNWRCESLVVACGGPSIPKMGSTGFGYEIARRFGLPIIAPTAALVPLIFEGRLLAQMAKLAGVSCPVVVSCGGMEFAEALLFTHRGLSGPSILQISTYWQPGESITLNLLPEVDLAERLRVARSERPKASPSTLLTELLPKRLAAAIASELGLPDRFAALSNRQLSACVERVQAWCILPTGTEGLRTAEVTRGGVDTRALSPTRFEVKTQPGLFFVGEVVDVTGWLGGYNFQWAWASGHAAGQVV
jgi:predicted Rossmann fold flavoprotein